MHGDAVHSAAAKVGNIGAGKPGAYLRALGRLDRSKGLDPAVRAVAPLATRVVANKRIRRLIHGDATGIPLHGVFTDVPFGAWWMAQFLDLFPDAGTRRASRRLVGVGLLFAVPTALTGLGEWALSDRGTRRVGIVHASTNVVGILIYLCSWVARVRGRHDIGARLGWLGGPVLIAGGMLGGYMRSERPSSLDAASADEVHD
jgi:hypothetical protein